MADSTPLRMACFVVTIVVTCPSHDGGDCHPEDLPSACRRVPRRPTKDLLRRGINPERLSFFRPFGQQNPITPPLRGSRRSRVRPPSLSKGSATADAVGGGVPDRASNRKFTRPKLLNLNRPQFRHEGAVARNRYVPHRYRKPEPALPDAARIQAACRSNRAYFRYVRVTADHEIETRGIGFFENVRHENPLPAGGQHETLGQIAAGRNQVHITADGVYRRDAFQFLQNRNLAHIPGVDDRPDALKELCDPRPQESMGVGDDTQAIAGTELRRVLPGRVRTAFPRGRGRSIWHSEAGRAVYQTRRALRSTSPARSRGLRFHA